MFARGQETYSYYGPLNLLSYNVRLPRRRPLWAGATCGSALLPWELA